MIYIRNFDDMQRCLLQLLSDKTVLYATHHLEFIEAADLVLVSSVRNNDSPHWYDIVHFEHKLS